MRHGHFYAILALVAWALFPHPPAEAARSDRAPAWYSKGTVTHHSSRWVTASSTAQSFDVTPLAKHITFVNTGAIGNWYVNMNGTTGEENYRAPAQRDPNHSIPILPGRSFEWSGWTSKYSVVSDNGASPLIVVPEH